MLGKLSSKKLVVFLLVLSLRSSLLEQKTKGKPLWYAPLPSLLSHFIPPSFLLDSSLLSLFISFVHGSCRLVSSLLLTQGCRLLRHITRSFSPQFHVKRCNVVALSHRILGASWHQDYFFYQREDGTIQAMQSSDTRLESCTDQRSSNGRQGDVKHCQGIRYCYIDALYSTQEQRQSYWWIWAKFLKQMRERGTSSF